MRRSPQTHSSKGIKRSLPTIAGLGLAALVGAGVAARLVGCFTDLWLDEVWMIVEVGRLESFLDVFRGATTSFHHLNALLLRAIGERDGVAVYRLHSLAAGLGTIWLAGRIARRRGRIEEILATLLVAGSYPLIHYSSEARGYSLAVFFAFAACLALTRIAEDGDRRALPAYWIAAVLGFLSQLTFLYFLFAAIVGTVVERRGRGLPVLSETLRRHAVPVALFAGFWWVSVRSQSPPLGPHWSIGPVILRSLAWATGGPAWAIGSGALGLLAGAAALAAVGLGALALFRLFRTDRARFAFFGMVVALAPAVVLGVTRFDEVYERYFLLPIAFFLLLAAEGLAASIRRGGTARATALALVGVMLLGNAWNASRFLAMGRGGYREAMRVVAARTAEPVVTFGSDHDFRNGILLGWYGSRILDRPLVYYRRGEYPPEGPGWIVTHSLEEVATAAPTLRDDRGNPYRLEREFPFASLSGSHWFLYRNARAELPGPTPPDAPPAPR